jgi:hypothetical protein
VQYRTGSGRLTFHAWKRRNVTSYWSMGGEVAWTGGSSRQAVMSASARTKVVRRLIDLSGNCTDGSARRAVIFDDGAALKIDMSDYDRPTATGSVFDIFTIKVDFPDEVTHTGMLEPPKRIVSDNGSVWTKI